MPSRKAHGDSRAILGNEQMSQMANAKEVREMKQHKFWAYAMVVCAVMAIYTGKKHA